MSAPTTEPELAVQILHVPHCPNVGTVRALVQQALTALYLSATIEEAEGPYPSPTLVINGVEVIPRPDAIEASCRLDLPTEAQILDALARATGKHNPDTVDRGTSAHT
ncbi:MAG TPA: hypothetical protein VFA11_05175 [Acidimicrobiales bacterium]|nr:hypothetical protein [Acidimicrobiales bacterium]